MSTRAGESVRMSQIMSLIIRHNTNVKYTCDIYSHYSHCTTIRSKSNINWLKRGESKWANIRLVYRYMTSCLCIYSKKWSRYFYYNYRISKIRNYEFFILKYEKRWILNDTIIKFCAAPNLCTYICFLKNNTLYIVIYN